MARIRVLVVDDSVVSRRVLSAVLSSEPTIEVVGTAANGLIALAKITQLHPDLVTLDIEMPEMSGLDVLAEIRKAYPALPVIMVSAHTQRDPTNTLQALSLGASDYVGKPTDAGSVDTAVDLLRRELVPKVKALCSPDPMPEPPRRRGRGSLALVSHRPQDLPAEEVGVLAVGASTGGPNALTALFAQLAATPPVPILIVQHMPPVFTKLLADRLSATCRLRFHEAMDGDLLQPGQAWIARGDHHMRIVRDGGGARIALDQGPPENSCRPAVDVLFRSVAATYGAATLAVVLTGMGQDGLRGCEHVHERGGRILVQDQPSSVVWGMPGFVARAGLADAVLPLAEIAREIKRRTTSPRAANARTRVG